MQQHQRQQAHHLGLWQQFHQQTPEADRLAGQVFTDELGADGRRVAFVEHQVNHPQHAVESLGQFRQGRHLVGNFRVADFRFGPHDALGNGGRCGKKRPGDFFGGQVADFAQCQRHLSIRRECRVTAGEDQAQAIVFHVVVTPVGLLQRLQLSDQHWPGRGKPRAATQHIDGLETPGGNQPRPWIVRHTVTLPALDRDKERLMQGLFGEVEIAKQTDQGRQDPPRLFAVNLLDPSLDRHPGHQSCMPCVTMESPCL